ncbi:hypothetical protein BCR35DRAFT_301120 [Leucosporidium creatinivorum]|uniref:Uncharacterized protein n=1 Tax=Leucosporidium creatinivorum TaxID=106004 RepID=A0A1Y2FXK1_9BASI|nr:hypothetical protein BCR35DRAFT_301120 [Leucosporidium creatinivorum]
MFSYLQSLGDGLLRSSRSLCRPLARKRMVRPRRSKLSSSATRRIFNSRRHQLPLRLSHRHRHSRKAFQATSRYLFPVGGAQAHIQDSR